MSRQVQTTLTAEIQAPRTRVYEYRLDCMNLPHLNPAVSNVRRTDAGTGKPGPGTQYVCNVRLDWGETTATVNIEDAVEPSLIVLDMDTVARDDGAGVSSGGVHSREVARFSDIPGGGTRIEIELTLQAPDDMADEAFHLMEEHAGDPIHVELAAMKRELEGG